MLQQGTNSPEEAAFDNVKEALLQFDALAVACLQSGLVKSICGQMGNEAVFTMERSLLQAFEACTCISKLREALYGNGQVEAVEAIVSQWRLDVEALKTLINLKVNEAKAQEINSRIEEISQDVENAFDYLITLM